MFFLLCDALQKPAHLLNPSCLRGDDGLQDRSESGTDAEAQCILAQSDGALMVRDHLSDKVGADVVV